VNSQAKVAKKKVLSVPQAALNQSVSQPMVALSVATLKERMSNVTQSRVINLIAGGDQNQPLPATRRIATKTATSSRNQISICRGSLPLPLPRAGSWSKWQPRNAVKWIHATAIKARDHRP